MSDLLPADDGLYALGSDTRRWLNAFLKGRLGVGVLLDDGNRVNVGELPDESILPTGTTYNLIRAWFNGAKLGKNLTSLSGLLCGGSIDLYGFVPTSIRGLYFTPTIMNTGAAVTITNMEGVTIGTSFTSIVGGVTITNRSFLRLTGASVPAGVTIGTQRGIYIPNLPTSSGATNIGIDIDNQTSGATKKLLRAKGLSQSNFEVDAGDPPNLGSTTEAESAILISFNENGTPTVRKVRWKQQDQLAATDKVLVAA